MSLDLKCKRLHVNINALVGALLEQLARKRPRPAHEKSAGALVLVAHLDFLDESGDGRAPAAEVDVGIKWRSIGLRGDVRFVGLASSAS